MSTSGFKYITNKVIAVDFDGTLCENAWPEIGEPIQSVIDYVLEEQRSGTKLILWTNRSDAHLADAIAWCRDRGIVFDAVNENLPECVAEFGNNSRKVFAHQYIDDKGITPNDIILGDIVEKIGKKPILVERKQSFSSYICLIIIAILFAAIGIMRLVTYSLYGGIFVNLTIGITYLSLGVLWIISLLIEKYAIKLFEKERFFD